MFFKRLHKNQTCSRWLLSAYPSTKSQYRVVAKLGPGRSSMLLIFTALLAEWTLRFLRLGTEVTGHRRVSAVDDVDGKARAASNDGQGNKDAATRKRIVGSE